MDTPGSHSGKPLGSEPQSFEAMREEGKRQTAEIRQLANRAKQACEDQERHPVTSRRNDYVGMLLLLVILIAVTAFLWPFLGFE